MPLLLDLFISFVKVGAVMFGGGYAMLPILQASLVDKKHWITQEEIMDCYAISQCTPGVIAVNTATFVGHKLAKIPGAIIASLGVVFPSVVVITVIAMFLRNFADLEVVRNAFAGIRVCVCVLVVNAVIKLWKSAIVSKFSIVVFLIVLGLAAFTDLSKIYFVVGAGLAGFCAWQIKKRTAAK